MVLSRSAAKLAFSMALPRGLRIGRRGGAFGLGDFSASSTADSVSAISPASPFEVLLLLLIAVVISLSIVTLAVGSLPRHAGSHASGRAPIAAPKAGGHIALFFLSFSISAFHIASESYPALRTLSAHSCLMGTTAARTAVMN